MGLDRDEYVRLRAYELWAKEGQPEGRERDHWARANAEYESGLKYFRLVRTAAIDDPALSDSPMWGAVDVVAPTPEYARAMALDWEREQTGGSKDAASVLSDPALYRIEQLDRPATNKAGVIGLPDPNKINEGGGETGTGYPVSQAPDEVSNPHN